MANREAVSGALIAAVSWIAGYVVTHLIGDGMSAVSAYALIIGWWLTAYAAAVFQVQMTATLPLGGLYFIFFLVAGFVGNTWFYRDVESLGVPMVFLVGFTQAVGVVSPIFFNSIFQRIVKILVRTNNRGS